MVTLVGTQNDFKDVIINLLELEYDAIGAYKLAIEQLVDLECRSKLDEFLNEHECHINQIKDFYFTKLELPDHGDLIKGTLVKAKVAIGKLSGADINILRAMLDNEFDTNAAYKMVLEHPDLPPKLSQVLLNAYNDEIRHKAWFETYITNHS